MADSFDTHPFEISDNVFECGFNSPHSAMGHSYFIKHPDGNWLINTPQFLPEMVNKLESMGGVSTIFMTHRDDVGECRAYAKHFRARRMIHKEDQEAQPDAEVIFDSSEPFGPQSDFLIIPTPGHTEGHCMVLYKHFLISGDSLHFDRKARQIDLWGPYWTWQDFDLQTESARKLLKYDFEWLLPIHGDKVQLPVDEMKNQLTACITRAEKHPERGVPSEDQIKKLNYYVKELEKVNQPEYAQKMRQLAKSISTELGSSAVN